ncbi:MAG: hypothetical protein AAF851_17350 [Myxococcota bacterium]
MRSHALCLLGLFACAPAETNRPYPEFEFVPEGEVIATVGPVQITTGEIERRLAKVNPITRRQFRSADQLETFVRNEVDNEILAREAFDRGLFEHPDVQAALRQAAVRELLDQKAKELEKDIEPTQAEILDVYKQREDRYFQPETIRIARLALAYEGGAEAKAKEQRLQGLLKKIQRGERGGDRYAFDRVAREITGESGASRDSVDMGFKNEVQLGNEVGAELAKQLFEKSTVGDMLVGRTEQQVLLLKKTGRRKEVRRSFESVRAGLAKEVRAFKRTKALRSYVESVAKERGVDAELQNLDAIEIPGLEPKDEAKEPAPNP